VTQSRTANRGNWWGIINLVPQSELCPEKNWQALFDPVEIDTSHLPPLGTLLTIHRGPTTGEVNLFCLSQQEVDENNLDERHLSRIVRKPSQIDGYDYQEADWKEAREKGEEVWLLDPDQIPGVSNTIADFKLSLESGKKGKRLRDPSLGMGTRSARIPSRGCN